MADTVDKEPKTDLKRSRDESFPGPHDQKAKRQKVRPLDLETDKLILVTCQSRIVLGDAMKDMKFMCKRGFPVELSAEEKKAVEAEAGFAEATEEKKKELLEHRKGAAEFAQFSIIHDRNIPLGCSLIRCEEKQQRPPSELVKILLDRVSAKEEKSKHLGRLIALDHLCKPTLEAFQALAEKTIKPLFQGDKSKMTWALQFKARGIKNVSKDAVLKVIDQWSDGCKVNIDDPSICINIEINPIFCGIALLDGWSKYQKYNVQSLQNPEAAEKERKRQQDQQKAKAAAEGTSEKKE